MKQRTSQSCRLESYGWGGLTVVLLDESAYETGWKCWQHGGEIVSSRLAESALTDEPLDPAVIAAGAKATATLRERIASFHDAASAADVFLFSSGMAAIFAVHRILTKRTPDEPTIQIEFPYLDSFKVQKEFGAGVIDFSLTESGGVEELRTRFEGGEGAAAPFCACLRAAAAAIRPGAATDRSRARSCGPPLQPARSARRARGACTATRRTC